MRNNADNRDNEPYVGRATRAQEPAERASPEEDAAVLVEDREERRIPYYLECNLYGDMRFCCGRVLNLSRGGMRVMCFDLLGVGDLVHVDCELPTGRLWVKASVAWVNHGNPIEPPGMGLKFVDLSSEAHRLIAKALAVANELEL